MSFLRRVLYFLCLAGAIYGGYHGHVYYLRATYLPVRYPFISSNAFRHLATHYFDQPTRIWIDLTGQSFDPAAVNDGDIIFIKNGLYYMSRFFANIHPRIKARYILLSHNGDDPIPGIYENYLKDDKLVAWAGCNVNLPEHKKMIPVPIGIMGILNKKLPMECQEIWGKMLLDLRMGKIKKTNFFYNNISICTNFTERGKAVSAFKDKDFCFNAAVKPYGQYLPEMATFKFVLSPHGAGFDCYRTWEALMLGCIPVVKKSCLDGLYEGLPVLIVDDWSEATKEFLEQKYVEMAQKMVRNEYCLEKLTIDYWAKVIVDRSTKLMEQR